MTKQKTEQAKATVAIPRSGKVLCTFRIVGIKAILLHNPAGSLTGPKGPKVKMIPSPEEEAEAGTYRMGEKPDGQLYIKSEAFFGSIVGKNGGASGRKFGKVSAASRILSGVDFDIEECCPLFHPTTNKPISTYEIDIRPAVIGKARILRARPKITEWLCYLSVEIDQDFITVEQFGDLLNISGGVAGVCDNRPQCHGRFGKYTAELHSCQPVAT
jgi:hypothetical protein